MQAFASILPPLHRDGHKFVLGFAIATLILFVIASWLGWLGVILTAWCVYFFRDPARVTPTREGVIVSPADGRVQLVERAVPPPELDMGSDARPRISIFMNVFDVHVNRVPASGTIVSQAYRNGKFMNAALDKASEENERQAVRMRTSAGQEIAFVQIAGLIARRIKCELADGQAVQAGERFGLIRFGSRVDVYLDVDMMPLVLVGQIVVAGETVLADARVNAETSSGEGR